jgi:hypothetical protein
LVSPPRVSTHVASRHCPPYPALGIWRDDREQVPTVTRLAKDCPPRLSDSSAPDLTDPGWMAFLIDNFLYLLGLDSMPADVFNIVFVPFRLQAPEPHRRPMLARPDRVTLLGPPAYQAGFTRVSPDDVDQRREPKDRLASMTCSRTHRPIIGTRNRLSSPSIPSRISERLSIAYITTVICSTGKLEMISILSSWTISISSMRTPHSYFLPCWVSSAKTMPDRISSG